jgi:hypothetical protein
MEVISYSLCRDSACVPASNSHLPIWSISHA